MSNVCGGGNGGAAVGSKELIIIASSCCDCDCPCGCWMDGVFGCVEETPGVFRDGVARDGDGWTDIILLSLIL